jgi:1-acyl-sn-glycerol-3-phosphate acyltransferase
MISNHQSILDILVLYSLFRHFKWVSKIENFHLPVVGWNMSLNRYIRLDRQRSKSFLKMIRDAEKSLSEGNSVMIFPEGTRSLDNHFRSFKEGAFVIALRSKKPILPIVLHGTGDAIPKKGFVLRKNSNIRVRVLEPVPFESFSHMTAAELSRSMNYLMTLAHEELKTEIN